jgi:hypothetical protein
MTLSHKTQLTQLQLALEQQRHALDAQQQAYPTTTGTERFRINANGTINIGGLEVPSVNLDEGAWDVPISQLVDLWTVRHGSKWVGEDELDDFYEVASTRLRQLNKLEQHYVNGKDVYRIVE